ncbi:hypothetical protein [Fretibacterium fastidiosum]|uniref:hypothetical protein n=1 Tax=Fretibacterium fastidiosum TaxID=651822 RepID=UPI001AD81F14|nr:hypothetical protein [Fretibacterium fastidiosum]
METVFFTGPFFGVCSAILGVFDTWGAGLCAAPRRGDGVKKRQGQCGMASEWHEKASKKRFFERPGRG